MSRTETKLCSRGFSLRRLRLHDYVDLLETLPLALNTDNFNALRQGLRELGYVAGIDFRIDDRSADGAGERFPPLAAELVRAQVDIIVMRGTPAALAALAAKAATRGKAGQAMWRRVSTGRNGASIEKGPPRGGPS